MSSLHHLPWALLNSCSDKDHFPPPPTQSGKKREAAAVAAERKSCGGAASAHDIHIWTERERRKKMRTMFANLHALLPHLPAKVDKSSLVDEAVNHIRTLQQTLQNLHKQKLERLNNDTNPSLSFSKIVHHPSARSSAATTREAFLADQASSTNDMSSTLFPQLSTVAAAGDNVVSILPSPPSSFQTWLSSNLVLNVCGHHAHFCICSVKKPGLFPTLCYVLEKHEIHVVSAHVSSDYHRSFFMIHAHVNGGYDEFEAATVAEDTFKEAAREIIFWLSS
ncbi:transcription factor bHLH95-like [Cucurbita pepo subsp. pepo]|uniref:transcription factor bHLH95-like n=1 Tax=Cucurbita pepo subsp. pepo TaxID=3664 RepID=UPI000C9D78FE|nr:transcription factor bHLH95-like [Cucurbita pepo subsp. pepo]